MSHLAVTGCLRFVKFSGNPGSVSEMPIQSLQLSLSEMSLTLPECPHFPCGAKLSPIEDHYITLVLFIHEVKTYLKIFLLVVVVAGGYNCIEEAV